jgi:hypothetical protein
MNPEADAVDLVDTDFDFGLRPITDESAVSPVPMPAADEPPSTRRIWSLPDAARVELPPPRWLINGLLPGDGTALTHGDVRVGKSVLLNALGLAVASGVPAFGCPSLTVPEAEAVAYVTEEDPFARLVERSRKMAAGYGLDALPANFYILPPSGLSLDDADDQRWLIGELAARHVRLVILDPVRSLTACADAGPKDLKPFVLFLRELQRQTGAVVALAHHDTKPQAGVVDTRRRGHKASGGAIFSIADAPIHVERHSEDVQLVPHDYKFAAAPPRLLVRPVFEPTAIRFLVTTDTAGDTDTPADLLDLVREYVTGHPGQSTNAIRQALGRRQDDIARALVTLHQRQQVTCERRGMARRWTAASSSHLFVPYSSPPIGGRDEYGRTDDGVCVRTNGTNADERDEYQALEAASPDDQRRTQAGTR